jgi:hypothetical protein
MVEGKIVPVVGRGRVVGPEGSFCKHEVDVDAFPGWDAKLGKIFTCKLCGAKVYNTVLASQPLGKRVRVSKKERRRQKALERE